MPLSSTQKAAVAQFVSITGAGDKIGQKYLKNAGYKLDDALDTYYQQNPGSGPGAARESSLVSQFEGLRDASDDANCMGAESIQNYFESLDVNFEDASLFVALNAVKSDSLGTVTKEGFVNGWKEAGVDGNIADQKRYLQNQISHLAQDPDQFRAVYKTAFLCSKEKSGKAIDLETAFIVWGILFQKPGIPWASASGRDWLELWTTFLKEKYSKTVNQDMWNQTLAFALKTLQDDTLSFYSEDGAWHSVVDDFVSWFRARGESMEVDS